MINDLKKIPKIVNNHYNQMNNTMEILYNTNFAILKIKPIVLQNNENEFTITWDNQVFNEGVNASNFLLIDAYEKIINNRSFQILLFDGSIIRCSLKFKNDILLSQNLSWIPFPLKIEELFEERINIEPQDISNKIGLGIYEKKDILLRSAVRIDYDLKNNRENHHSSHMHIQNPDTRIYTNEPICFNSFIKHIIRTYYPEEYYIKKGILPEEVYRKLNLNKLSGLSFKRFKADKESKIKENTMIYLESIPMG